MKRGNAVLIIQEDEQRSCPYIPIELWQDIISFQDTTNLTISSVFMLDKTINAYLFKYSPYILKRVLTIKLNILCSKSSWFICTSCNRLSVETSAWIPRALGDYCSKCVMYCEVCNDAYVDCIRSRHKICRASLTGQRSPDTSNESFEETEIYVDDEVYVYDYEEEEEEERIARMCA